MTTATPPRRKWHLQRWLLVLAAGLLAYAGWTTYAFRSALKEAWALGWDLSYTDPVEAIRGNWKAAFKKETWTDGVIEMKLPTSEEFEQHLAIVHRLNPIKLGISSANTLQDLSGLKALNRLQWFGLVDCAGLTNVDALSNFSDLERVNLAGGIGLSNVDALKNLYALRYVGLFGCTGLTNVDALKNLASLLVLDLTGCTRLTNVDALKNLTALRDVYLTGCTGLTKESVASLKAALPNTQIIEP